MLAVHVLAINFWAVIVYLPLSPLYGVKKYIIHSTYMYYIRTYKCSVLRAFQGARHSFLGRFASDTGCELDLTTEGDATSACTGGKQPLFSRRKWRYPNCACEKLGAKCDQAPQPTPFGRYRTRE